MSETKKVRLLQSLVEAMPSGAVRARSAGDVLELEQAAAQRLCWHEVAEPVGWKCPECPPEASQAEECRRDNLEREIVTPATVDDIRKLREERKRKAAGQGGGAIPVPE